MAKVILAQRDGSGYNDEPGKWYHFPKMYLRSIERAIGDECIFYEPSRGEGNKRSGRSVYWAAATVGQITPDPDLADHFYVQLHSYLPFINTIKLRRADRVTWEKSLSKPDGTLNMGKIRRSVRQIPDDEFSLILSSGYAHLIASESDNQVTQHGFYQVAEEQAQFERPIISQLTNRPFRDRVFAQQVRNAYDSRCAVTGLKIINGGGRAEMEAAHIQPVTSNGPDTVRNGIALSRTVHWMFDRGLISIDDDFRLLKAKGKIPDGAERLFEPSGYIKVPDDERAKPTPQFLRWHRENCFKG